MTGEKDEQIEEKEQIVYCERCQTGWALNYKRRMTAKLVECPLCAD
jgi:hypothetical protein